MSQVPTARQVALDLIGAVLRRKRPLDDAIEDNPAMAELSVRDRAFARLLVATVLRRLGQIDALIARLPQHAAGAAGRDRSTTFCGSASPSCCFCARRRTRRSRPASISPMSRGFLSHKGLVNAVLRRLSVEGAGRVEAQDAARLNTPDWLWQSWSRAYGEECARAIADAHLKEAPLDLTLRGERRHERSWCEKLQATKLPTGSLRRVGGRLGHGAAGLCRGRLVDPGRGRLVAGAPV